MTKKKQQTPPTPNVFWLTPAAALMLAKSLKGWAKSWEKDPPYDESGLNQLPKKEWFDKQALIRIQYVDEHEDLGDVTTTVGIYTGKVGGAPGFLVSGCDSPDFDLVPIATSTEHDSFPV